MVSRGTAALALSVVVQVAGCNAFGASHHDDGAGGVALTAAADFATGQQSPNAVIVDASSVYWLNESSAGKTGALMKLDKGGGGGPVILASSIGDPVGLAQDTTRVFVASNKHDGAADYQFLYRQDKAGGGPTPLQVGANGVLFGVAVVGGDAIFAMQPLDQRTPEGRVVAVPTDVWVPTSSREVAHDTPGGVTSATVVAADSSFVYAATNGVILRIVNEPHGAESAFAQTNGTAKAILLDSGVLYWIDGAKIRSLSADKAGAQPTEVATAQNDPRGIAVHGDDIFWTNAGDGSVFRASKKDGTGAVAIAKGEAEPIGITVDGAGVIYWTNRADGRIRVVRPR